MHLAVKLKNVPFHHYYKSRNNDEEEVDLDEFCIEYNEMEYELYY